MRLLGETEKTGVSFGLAPGPLNTGGTCPASSCSGLCGQCYARSGGHYSYQCVKASHARRLEVSKTDDFVPMMVSEFVGEARKAVKRKDSVVWFRGHDSGDFYSVDYIDKWIAIVKQVRQTLRAKPATIRYWFPTRTWTLPGWLSSLRALNAQQGVVVKPSALEVDAPAPCVEGLAVGTMVGKGWGTCPAIENSFRNRILPVGQKLPTSCKDCKCRRCWNALGQVVYRLH